MTHLRMQFALLLSRDFTQYWRNVPYNGTRFVFGAGFGLIMGCIFWSTGDRRYVGHAFSWLLAVSLMCEVTGPPSASADYDFCVNVSLS